MMRALSFLLILAVYTWPEVSFSQTVPTRTGRACTPDEMGNGALDFSMVSPEVVGGLESIQASLVYPEYDRRTRVEGTVVIRLVVGLEGRACDTEVARAVSIGLGPAALTAVEQARYTVGRQNGQPVAVRMTIPVRFTLP